MLILHSTITHVCSAHTYVRTYIRTYCLVYALGVNSLAMVWMHVKGTAVTGVYAHTYMYCG